MEEKRMSYEEARAFLETYIKENRKSQAEVAKEIGKSPGLVSAFLSGEYKTPHAVIPIIEELKRIHEKKKIIAQKPDYVETSMIRTITNIIEYARLRGMVAIAYGDPGVGKTYAVEKYVEKNNFALAITTSPTYASITGVNELIAQKMGIRERVSRKMTELIIERLQGSGMVLIVDEAQHLTVRALDHLRCMTDESGVGLALIGNDSLHDKIYNSKNGDFKQMYSRIGLPAELRTKDITMEDIKKIFEGYGLEDEVLKLMLGVAHTGYGLRGVANVFVNTAANYEGKIEKAGVIQSIRMMKINA